MTGSSQAQPPGPRTARPGHDPANPHAARPGLGPVNLPAPGAEPEPPAPDDDDGDDATYVAP
jgi:hypothetical protein